MIVRPGYKASTALRSSSATSNTDGIIFMLWSIKVSTAPISVSFVASLKLSRGDQGAEYPSSGLARARAGVH